MKKPKTTTSPCAISPVLIECPEQDCSKKYKHANGLKYHQSHAHGIITNTEDETLLVPPDSPFQYSSSSTSNEKVAETTDSSSLNNKIPLDTSSQPPPPQQQPTASTAAIQTTPEKPLSIKSVLQLNEGQPNVQKTFVKSPSSEETSKTALTEDESAVDASIKSAPLTESLDKSKFYEHFFSAFDLWNNALICPLWLPSWLAGSLRSQKLERFKTWDSF